MNKLDFISEIAELSGITKADAEKALDAFVKTVENALSSGEEVRLIGFGTFSAQMRPEMAARNLKTGEKMTIPARKIPKFKAGKLLKDAVAGK